MIVMGLQYYYAAMAVFRLDRLNKIDASAGFAAVDSQEEFRVGYIASTPVTQDALTTSSIGVNLQDAVQDNWARIFK